MKKKFMEAHRSIIKKIGCLALAVVVAGTGVVTYQNVANKAPELPVYVDQDKAVKVSEDAVPLASGTKTTKKVSTKTTTKKTTMAKKATKNSTTTKKSTSQKTATKRTTTQSVKTVTKVETTIKTQTKKNSKVKTTVTKVVTTVTTTTTQLATTTTNRTNTITTSTSSSTAAAGSYKIRSVAPKADSRVLSAFEKIGAKVVVNPSVSYSGCFDAQKRTITLKKLDSTVYHELGHFVEFVGGTTQVKQKIASAYSSEKSKYTAYNRAYVIQNSSEYFAESFKNYCENPAALKASRPNTYNAVVAALNAMTTSRVNTLISVYSSAWK
ncbi:MAG: hypothetical protein Q4E91_08075 [Lachnospiraceae bacterium]|nr:hypothetical protein [Lachnospiraceae bacterium]